MADGEVGRLLAWFRRFWFQEVRAFAKMIVVQFLLKGLVSGFREHGFFFKNRQNTHRLYSNAIVRISLRGTLVSETTFSRVNRQTNIADIVRTIQIQKPIIYR